MAAQTTEKKELFESMPIPKALATLAIPTIISQMINVIYNMVDTFFIGRTGNSYMLLQPVRHRRGKPYGKASGPAESG